MERHRTKTSRIWTMSSEEFCEIYESSSSMTEMLAKLGYPRNEGDSTESLKARIKLEGLNSVDGRIGRISQFRKPLNEVLVTNSTYQRRDLKRQLMRENLLGSTCSICNIEPEWKEKPLVLILDHINGIHNDNRIENLRLVCPNCNSQLPTFAGRNAKH